MPDRSTPSELLATLLLGDRASAVAAADETTRRGLWENTVRLAVRWRCLPRLRVMVAAIGAAMDDGARRSLSTLSAAAAAQSAMVCHRASVALAALESAGIRAASFKGLGMIASVYGNPADRMLSDADILLEEKDFPKASAVLREAGFTPAISMGFDAWLELLKDRVYPVHDFVDFVDASGTKLDLHWRIRTPTGGGFWIGEILDRSVQGTIARRSVRVVTPEDSMLLTSHHLVRGRLAPRSAVKDLCDITAWVDAPGERRSLEILAERARNAGLSTSLLAALLILVGFEPDGPAADAEVRIAAGCSAREKTAAKRLAAFFKLQLQRGTVSETIVGLTDVTPSLAGRFIISRLRSITDAKYRRHKFAGHEKSRAWVDARVFLRDLLTLTPRRFALYRALARETRAYAEADRAD